MAESVISECCFFVLEGKKFQARKEKKISGELCLFTLLLLFTRLSSISAAPLPEQKAETSTPVIPRSISRLLGTQELLKEGFDSFKAFIFHHSGFLYKTEKEVKFMCGSRRGSFKGLNAVIDESKVKDCQQNVEDCPLYVFQHLKTLEKAFNYMNEKGHLKEHLRNDFKVQLQHLKTMLAQLQSAADTDGIRVEELHKSFVNSARETQTMKHLMLNYYRALWHCMHMLQPVLKTNIPKDPCQED